MTMSRINRQIDILGRQFSKLQRRMEEQKLNSEKTAEDVIASTKEEIKQLSEHIHALNENDLKQSSSGILKAQTIFNEKKKKLKSRVADKKTATEKNYIRKEVDAATEFAAFTMDFALLAIDEATLAFYEAVEKSEKYIKKYGDDDK